MAFFFELRLALEDSENTQRKSSKCHLREEEEGRRASSRTRVRALPRKQALELVFPLPMLLHSANQQELNQINQKKENQEDQALIGLLRF